MSRIVSIIVPIYNVEQFVEKCIKSIINQDYSNLEIILIDDGSMDNSGEICDKYAAEDNRIKVVHTVNYGVTHARKIGVELAKGEFIGFVDGDDYIDSNYYQILLDKMVSDDYDFVQMGVIYEYKNGKHSTISGEEKSYNIEGKQIEVICEGLLGSRKQIDLLSNSLCLRLFRTDSIRTSLSFIPDDLIYGEDMACMCQYIMRSKRFAIIEKAGYHYIQRDLSAVHDKNIDFIAKNSKLYDYIISIFDDTPYSSRVKLLMGSYLIHEIANAWESVTGRYIAMYEFPDINMLFGKKIVLYGAGKVGIDYYRQICRYKACKIEAFVDTYYGKYVYDDIDVFGIEKINDISYDLLIISVLKEETANEIISFLLNNKVEEKKILWCEPKSIYSLG